jgi:hypothetical protein
MTRTLIRHSFVLATLALLGFARTAAAEPGVPFKIAGTETGRVLLDVTDDGFVVQTTVFGEGTIGSYMQISVVTLTFGGDETLKFEDETTIYVLNGAGEPTGDVIYIEDTGTYSTGRNEGSYRIVGGEGLYEGASGAGAFKFLAPNASYNGVILE